MCLCAHTSRAQEELDDLLEGFEDELEEIITDQPSDAGPGLWELTGDLSVSASYAYAHTHSDPIKREYRGLAALRTQLRLQLDLDLPRDWRARVSGRGFYDSAYRIQGRRNFTDEALDTSEDELEFQEIWLQGSLLPQLDLKFGRQIVNWGRSETIRVIDVLNPLDNREPGLVDIEDLRLPVVMTKLDYYHGPWTLTGIAVHETRFDENPDFGSEFFPIAVPPPPENTPGNGGSNTEWAAALTGIFSGWDVSLHWARFFDDTAHLELVPAAIGPPRPQLEHARLTMLGASGNYAMGNWLLKAEAAYFDGLEYFVLAGDDKTRWDIMGGLEYAGFDDTTISLDVVRRHISGFDSRLENDPDFVENNRVETAFRYTTEFMNSRLRATYLATIFGTPFDGGGFMRLSCDYELRDALTIGGGIVLYMGGDFPTFEANRKNDRLFFTAKYSF